MLLLNCFNLIHFRGVSLALHGGPFLLFDDELAERDAHAGQYFMTLCLLHPLGELADFLEGTFLLLDLFILLRLQASVNLR